MSWQALHAVSDKLTPAMSRQLLAAFEESRRRVPVTALEHAIRTAGLAPPEIDRLLALIPQLIRQAGSAAVERAVYDASQVEAAQMGSRFKVRLDFEAVNPMAVQAARNQSALMVTRVTEQTRKAIRTVVSTAIESGVTARDAAKLVRTIVGLGESQAIAVTNYRARLLKAGATADTTAGAVDRYATKLLRQRSEMIARTELIDSLSAGQHAAWARAQSRGLLNAQAQMEWLVTPDDRLCEFCRAMSGQRAPVGGMFDTPFGPRRGPTLHPHCRCVLRLAASSLRGPGKATVANDPQDASAPLALAASNVSDSEKAVKSILAKATGEPRRVVNINTLRRVSASDLEALDRHYAVLEISRTKHWERVSAGAARQAIAAELRGRVTPVSRTIH